MCRRLCYERMKCLCGACDCRTRSSTATRRGEEADDGSAACGLAEIPMRLLSFLAVVALAPTASAQERFVERTPAQIFPQPHTMSRAGNSASVAWWATPSVGRCDRGGTVFGTFGLDFAGKFPGRVFRPE